MTATRGKKARRKRGYNRRLGVRRRGSGNRGGVGKSGRGKRAAQKRDMLVRIYGKVQRKAILKPKTKHSAVNISGLNVLVSKLNLKESKGIIKINLNEFGFDKLLSRGKPEHKFEVSCSICTQKAKEKIEKSGGKIICNSEEFGTVEEEADGVGEDE
ncbi:MAG: uL15 family ribosomal protein [Candidatus Nanoarchaeia archaeon]|nr:uL15 family ribosomal protein [Candidatus Nanoarchaeia archaeon]